MNTSQFHFGDAGLDPQIPSRSQARLAIQGILIWLALFVQLIQPIAATVPREKQAQLAEVRFLIKPKKGVNEDTLVRFHARNGCDVVQRFRGFGDIQVLRVPPGRPVQDLVRRYEASGLVVYAEPDRIVHLDNAFPNDPFFLDGTLWGLNNAGQNGGLPNADIDAPEAWSALTSASNVIVAVVDTGIRYTHEDLAGNMWTNPQDGSHGFNVVTGSTDPDDDAGHGTRVAGIIGALGNNSVGVAGVAWQVQLMACKFTGPGHGFVSDVLACLDFARTNGTRIVNASWGMDVFDQSLYDAFSTLQADGILVVAAAGNDARDVDQFPHYPANFDLANVVSVMATGPQDDVYWLSNFGTTNVDLAAPGTNIYSTDFQTDTSYEMDSGTSMAAPYVSGAAALLRAMHPGESPAQIIVRLLSTVDSLPALEAKCLSGGRLNLRKALAVQVTPPTLKGIAASTTGTFVLLLVGDPGRNYVVETSYTLGQWSPASTNLTGFTGTIFITNNIGTNAYQFFRARLIDREESPLD